MTIMSQLVAFGQMGCPAVTRCVVLNAHASAYNSQCEGNFSVKNDLRAVPETEDYSHDKNNDNNRLNVLILSERLAVSDHFFSSVAAGIHPR